MQYALKYYEKFTFQYVSINTGPVGEFYEVPESFTFQNVSINT